MTNTDIKIFKKFMMDRNLYLSFATNYRRHKLTVNPDSLDDYLEKSRAETVVVQAFVYPDSVYGKDFWLDIHEEWMTQLRNIRGERQNDKCLEDLDLEVIELKKNSAIQGLPKNTCSLSIRGGNRFVLNIEHSKMIARKLSTKMLLTRSRKTGDVVLIFNRTKGIDVRFKPGQSSLQFCSVELTNHLINLLDLDPEQEYYRMSIELLEESGDNLLFLLKN